MTTTRNEPTRTAGAAGPLPHSSGKPLLGIVREGEAAEAHTVPARPGVRAGTAPVPSPPPKGTRLGPYVLGDPLGRGGMGVVFRATDEKLKREVAVKVLLPQAELDEVFVKRFLREAQTAAKVASEYVVKVFLSGLDNGLLWYAMEYVKGSSLTKALKEKKIPSAATVALIAECVARGLQAVHDAGIVHRDVKPDNILLWNPSKGRLSAKLADFGIVKDLAATTEMTAQGDVLGTPNYMAPEQANDSGSADARSDVYALGGVLYHMLTGVPPHSGLTAVEVLARAQKDDATPPSRLEPTVARDLETICMKCLERDPDRRYQSAREVQGDLRRFLNHEPILARPVGWAGRLWRRHRRHRGLIAASLAFLAILGGGGWYAVHRRNADVAATAQQKELEKQDELNRKEQQRQEEVARKEREKQEAIQREEQARRDEVAKAEAQKEEEKRQALAKAKDEAQKKDEQDVKQAERQSPLSRADALAKEEKYLEAAEGYEAIWDKFDSTGQEELLTRMVGCCEKLTGKARCAEAWRLVLRHARTRPFGDLDAVCAQTLATERVERGAVSDNPWKWDREEAQLVEERLAIYLDGKTKETWPRSIATGYLDDVREHLGADPFEADLPKDDAAKLADLIDRPSTNACVRARASLALGRLLEKGGQDARGRYQAAWDWLLQAFPFYRIADGDKRARFFLDVQEAVHRLDPSVPERFQGELRIHCEAKQVPPKGSRWGVKVSLLGPPRAANRAIENPVTARPLTAYFQGGDLDLGVADGTYMLKIEEAPPEGDAAARDEARSYGLSVEGVPQEFKIEGKRVGVLVTLRALSPLKLVPPTDGASTEEQKGPLAWKPVDGAMSYMVVVEVPAKDAAVHLEMEVEPGQDAWLSDLLALASPADSPRLRAALAQGAQPRWGVEALADLNVRLASSGPLQPLPLATPAGGK